MRVVDLRVRKCNLHSCEPECLPSNEGSVAGLPALHGRVYQDESNNR